jgi:hypothetical protein
MKYVILYGTEQRPGHLLYPGNREVDISIVPKILLQPFWNSKSIYIKRRLLYDRYIKKSSNAHPTRTALQYFEYSSLHNRTVLACIAESRICMQNIIAPAGNRLDEVLLACLGHPPFYEA